MIYYKVNGPIAGECGGGGPHGCGPDPVGLRSRRRRFREPSPSRPAPQSAAPAESIRLDLLVYNIEYGGGPDTDRVMREVDADVVGVLESYARLPEIARKTGYPYYNVSLQLLSKYPIYEPAGGDGLYGLIEVRPGQVVPFFNEHLDYVAWGPRALKNGKSVASVVESEREVRADALEQPLESMGELLDEGYPVFLTGDFNEPSSLDYGEETVGTREGIDEPVPWPVSEDLFDLGFRDSYREEHPDPLKEPGLTHRSEERIDYVYAAGPSTTLDSKLIGEPGARDVDIEFSPWKSDHRAVLSTFEVTPEPMPTTVAVDHRLGTVGDAISIAYNAPGSDGNEIAIVPEGGDSADPDRDPRRARGRAARSSSTPAGWSRVAMRRCSWTATEQRWPRSPSGCAIRRRTCSCRPTSGSTGRGSRSTWSGRTAPRTGGIGSGSSRRRRRTRRTTTT